MRAPVTRAVDRFTAARYAHPLRTWLLTALIALGLLAAVTLLAVTVAGFARQPHRSTAAPVPAPTLTGVPVPARAPTRAYADPRRNQPRCEAAVAELVHIAATYPRRAAAPAAVTARAETALDTIAAFCSPDEQRAALAGTLGWLTAPQTAPPVRTTTSAGTPSGR